ncbi:unnamed protein product [Heligmosomoides polygyrus]|uniref:C-type lectin domain-containing protein n=1 Tax=Heligmosomoides polygyrus TaxID=6339 RepID=A0A183GAB0_HELPZ|nr:unnamed protein product [Heligmosomoides polygyrus]
MSNTQRRDSKDVLVVEAASPCPEGWRYFPVTNSCYKLLDDELPWTLAEFKCLFQGAHHASIDSAAENQFVHELARHGEMWTGAAVFGASNVYVNTDQTPYGAYTNWQGGHAAPPLSYPIVVASDNRMTVEVWPSTQRGDISSVTAAPDRRRRHRSFLRR